MTDAQTALAQVREALSAGPTPGPWSVETVPTSCGVCHKVGPFPGKRPDDPPRHACLYADYPSAGNPADDELMANANFIAACHPEAIRELLAEHDEDQKVIAVWRGRTERAEAELDDLLKALVAERDELRRQLAEAEQDAERYRWLRGREDGRYMTVYAFRTDIDEVCLGDELDAAIDAAMGLTRPAEES